jgi:hypothetical protein
MQAESAFQSYLEGALELLGIEADETERAVMAGIWSVYEPGLEPLRQADLGGVEPERNLDLSGPPSG